MEEELNICLHVEGKPQLVIESNINFRPKDDCLYAQVWQLGNPNKLLKSYGGRHALTDAVLHLSELLGEPIAHKLRKVNSNVA